MIGAMMALMHLARSAAEREGEHLVAEADAEDRLAGVDELLIAGTAYSPVAAGSPGPFDRNTPSGLSASTSSAVAVAGTTVTLHPAVARQRRMLRFKP